jgi:TetR/AcrR family transcriptional regulator, transcriptional repressor of aconitase
VPKVTQEHLDARRAQILEGARSAFAKSGYDGATVPRLEEAIGLSRGAIFHYFPGKRDLFVAVAVDVNRHFLELMATGGLAEALREMGRQDPEFLAVLIETHARMRHDEDFVRSMTEASEELVPPLEAWFSEAQKSGVLRADIDWKHLARFATLVTNGLAMRVAAGDETDVETVIQLLEDALGPQT